MTQTSVTGSLDEFRDLRKKAGYTQAQIAEMAGVSIATVGNLEKGVTRPRGDTADRLMAALHGKSSAPKPTRRH